MTKRAPNAHMLKGVNCVLGCSHNCRYCFVRYDAVFKTKLIKEACWSQPRVCKPEVQKVRKKSKGTIIFPTHHDITPETLEPCLKVLDKLLISGNQVVVDSKPHLACITRILEVFKDFRANLSFRFTIGALDNRILKYWEPGAPGFEERMDCLGLAYINGFKTAVVSRPLLEPETAEDLVERLSEFVTDFHLVGLMEKINQNILVKTPQDRRMTDGLLFNSNEDAIWGLFRRLKIFPKVRWCSVIEKVVASELRS